MHVTVRRSDPSGQRVIFNFLHAPLIDCYLSMCAHVFINDTHYKVDHADKFSSDVV